MIGILPFDVIESLIFRVRTCYCNLWSLRFQAEMLPIEGPSVELALVDHKPRAYEQKRGEVFFVNALPYRYWHC